MAQKFYYIDFCKRRQITAIDKVVELKAPFDTTEPAIVTGASLGCNVPVSHQPFGSGFVLSRIRHSDGKPIIGLLPGGDSDVLNEPGQTAWIHGVADPILEGTVAANFPVPILRRNYELSFAGMPWVRDQVPTQPGTFGPGAAPMTRAEFGGDIGIRRTCIVAGEQEFDVGPRIKALHRHRHYAQVATVGDDLTPLTLLSTSGTTLYRWPGSHSPVTVLYASSFFAHFGEGGDFGWEALFRVWGVHPAVVGHGALTLTDPVLHQNIDRKYSFFPIDDITAPDFGGSVEGSLNLTMRKPVHLYGKFITEGPAEHMRLLVNGDDMTDQFGAMQLPTPQFSGYPFQFHDEQYNSVYTNTALNINKWVVQVTSPRHVERGFSDPRFVGIITIGPDPVPGYFWEGTVYFSRFDRR